MTFYCPTSVYGQSCTLRSIYVCAAASHAALAMWLTRTVQVTKQAERLDTVIHDHGLCGLQFHFEVVLTELQMVMSTEDGVSLGKTLSSIVLLSVMG